MNLKLIDFIRNSKGSAKAIEAEVLELFQVSVNDEKIILIQKLLKVTEGRGAIKAGTLVYPAEATLHGLKTVAPSAEEIAAKVRI